MELLAVKLEKKQNGSTEVYAEKKILGSVSYTCRQPREQADIFLDIHFFLKSLRQRKISIKLLLVRLYRLLFCAYNGTCLTHF